MAQNYQSVTVWQGGLEWLVEVIVDGFLTPQAAAEFGSKLGTKLKYEAGADYLILEDKEGKQYAIEQGQVVTHKIKEESKDKMGLHEEEDFEVVQVEIKDFPMISGLNEGFGSLAYGVVLDGQPLSLKM